MACENSARNTRSNEKFTLQFLILRRYGKIKSADGGKGLKREH